MSVGADSLFPFDGGGSVCDVVLLDLGGGGGGGVVWVPAGALSGGDRYVGLSQPAPCRSVPGALPSVNVGSRFNPRNVINSLRHQNAFPVPVDSCVPIPVLLPRSPMWCKKVSSFSGSSSASCSDSEGVSGLAGEGTSSGESRGGVAARIFNGPGHKPGRGPC